MESGPSYQEPQKVLARRAVIEAAVKALTVDRTNSTLCRRSYVREVREALVARGSYDGQMASRLTEKTIKRWEGFYDSIVEVKSSDKLRVAYLCGPNPENDIRVFCEAGILPENIWAFESDTKTYLHATQAALASEFPFVKIIKGGLDTFVETSPIKFDIVYLDFCGPLPSRNKKQKTLLAITRIIENHALSSPGALITNVSLPSVQGDMKGRNLISKLVASYLYPKYFLEDGAGMMPEGPIANGLSPEEWLKKVQGDLESYYGQFVTRLLMDSASFITPYNRVLKNNSVFKNFFVEPDTKSIDKFMASLFHFDEDCDGGDIIADPSQYPVLWSFAALDKTINAGDTNYPDWINSDQDFEDFGKTFLRQLRTDSDLKKLIRNTVHITFSMGEGEIEGFGASSSMEKLMKSHSFQDYYQFCDLMLSHQIFELLFRQAIVPYHVNVSATKRWTYQAKEASMFMDMTIFDECRYLYDWMPTADMIAEGLLDTERQLSFRFALDGVSKHRRWYNSEYFFGTAVIGQFTEPFEAKVLSPRVTIQ